MPEPVVIIGPANGPAGPISEAATDTAAASDPESVGTPKERNHKTAQLGRVLSGLASTVFALLSRVLGGCGTLVLSIVRRYPRHSLAAGASVLILGAIWYSELGRRAPLNQIPGESAASAPKKTDDATSNAAPKTGNAASPTTITANTPDDPAAKNVQEPAAAAPVSAAPDGPRAPAPTIVANNDKPASPSEPPSTDLASLVSPDPAPAPANTPDHAGPTLLAGAPPEPAPSSPPTGVNVSKTATSANKSGLEMEAPAPFGAVAPAPAGPPESAPALTGASEHVQLATGLDEPNTTAPNSTTNPAPSGKTAAQEAPAAPLAPPGAPVGVGAAIADTKPNDTPKASEPHSLPSPADGPKTDPIAPSTPPNGQTELLKNEAAKPEQPPSQSPKVDEPAAGAPGSADPHKADPATPPLSEPPSSATSAADTTKPAAQNTPAPFELPVSTTAPTTPNPTILTPAEPAPPAAPEPVDSRAAITDSRAEVTESKAAPIEKRATDPEKQASPAAPSTASAEPKSPNITPHHPPASSPAPQNVASDGWVSVPNSGKIPVEDAAELDSSHSDAGSDVGTASAATRSVRGHTTKTLEFDPDSPQTMLTPKSDQSDRGSAGGSGGHNNSHSLSTERVEPTSHQVQPNENFWTISRLYYSSGRYYRALWNANRQVCPKIDRLQVSDVIVIPAVEDLDTTYIDPPRTTAPASLGTARGSGGRSNGDNDRDSQALAESSVSSSQAISGEPISTTRTNRASANGVPVRRSSRTDPDLDLPPPDEASDRAGSPDRTSRLIHRPLGDSDDEATSDEPRARIAARPRATSSGSGRHPVYRIRPRNTLRSIARDMLGDSHRADEILELNRNVIDDPANLTAGQLIQLPDDARTSVRRSADR